MRHMPINRNQVEAASDGRPRYEAIATAIEAAIGSGRLRPGARLPTVRELSRHLGFSGATVAAAYETLARRGWTRGEVGRGTFVRDLSALAGTGPSLSPGMASARAEQPWRRAQQTARLARLATAHPDAIDAASGTPDPLLLPAGLLQEAWQAEAAILRAGDLQYGDAMPAPELAGAVVETLNADGVPAAAADLVAGSSVLQLVDAALQCVLPVGQGAPVAVEEPGYAPVLDLLDRRGWRAIPVAVDEAGAMPGALADALRGGALAVVFTPRAHNPTGASWTPERTLILGDVIAGHPLVTVIEDDHAAGLVPAGPASLRSDARLARRVVYLRSFSKSVAPDLRLTIGVAPRHIRGKLLDSKRMSEGWSPRLAQRVLARVLRDDRLPALLEQARLTHAERRANFIAGLAAAGLASAGGKVRDGAGLNLWVELPQGADAEDVVDRAAAAGVIVQSGEGYYRDRGIRSRLRVSAARVPTELAYRLGQRLGTVIQHDPSTSGPRLPAV